LEAQENGSYEDSISFCDEILSMAPEQPTILSILAQAYEKQEKFEEAIRYYERAGELGKNGQSPHLLRQIFFDLGNVYERMSAKNEAMSAYEQILDSKPDSPLAWFGKGNIHRKREEYLEAITCYDNSHNHNAPSKIQTLSFYYRGLAYQKLGDYIRAIRNYHLSLATKRKGIVEPEIYLKLATAHIKIERYDIAIEEYKEAISHFGDDEELIRDKSKAHLEYSQQLKKRGKNKESKKQILFAKKELSKIEEPSTLMR